MAAAEADFERQAEEMAQRALPASLSAAARGAMLPAVKQKILARLRSEASRPAAPPGAAAPAAAAARAGVRAAQPLRSATSPAPPPTPDQRMQQLRVEGAELYGDERWYDDVALRARLRAAVAEAHREQKLLVAPAREEVGRICPADGRVLGAGAVLRLGGALGGYGEGDVSYSYRQLSRALHPDKNQGLAGAPTAFHRLSEAAEEMRRGLAEQRAALQVLARATGQPPPDEAALERPQGALLAEAVRLLTAVCGLAGEGRVPGVAETRALAAFAGDPAYQRCTAQQLLAEWFSRDQLLEIFTGAALRAAYDCSPKRYRAQFLCLLSRAFAAEGARSHGCFRDRWSVVAKVYPEVSLWCELRNGIRGRLWDAPEPSGRRSRSPARARRSMWGVREVVGSGGEFSKWAGKWRTALGAVLPSGEDGAVPATDAEARKLAYVLWRDVAAWAAAQGSETQRGLALFRAEPPADPSARATEWAFVPISDLFLVVGEGRVGVTMEGLFADNPPGHKRLSLADCYKKKAPADGG